MSNFVLLLRVFECFACSILCSIMFVPAPHVFVSVGLRLCFCSGRTPCHRSDQPRLSRRSPSLAEEKLRRPPQLRMSQPHPFLCVQQFGLQIVLRNCGLFCCSTGSSRSTGSCRPSRLNRASPAALHCSGSASRRPGPLQPIRWKMQTMERPPHPPPRGPCQPKRRRDCGSCRQTATAATALQTSLGIVCRCCW